MKQSLKPALSWPTGENRILLGSALIVQILAWLIYKWCIPGPDYFSDSFTYVYAAIHEVSIFYRPMGYARFLALLHGFSPSADFVVAVQYFMMSASALFFFFSLSHLMPFRNRYMKWLSWVLVSFEPIVMVQANLLTSDSLFTSLTIIWVTLLIWILLRPGWVEMLAQVLTLCLAFQVRYNALYYPVISCFVFLLASGASRIYRVAGIVLTLVCVGFLYQSIRTATEEETGAAVFSGFSGWQMANNALYCAPFMPLKDESFDDPDMVRLHNYVLATIDSIAPTERQAMYEGKIGSAFLWDNRGPLKQYLMNYSHIYGQSYFQSWYQVSPVFDSYGKTLILRHPWVYMRHFLWPNTCAYVNSDREYLQNYHHASMGIPKETSDWFGWDGDSNAAGLQSRHPAIQNILVAGYPYGHMLMLAICLLLPVIWFCLWRSRGASARGEEYIMRWFWYVSFGANIAFSVMAAPAVLRYETCWFILGGGFLVSFIDRLLAAYPVLVLKMKPTP